MSTRTSQRSGSNTDAGLSLPLEPACPDLSGVPAAAGASTESRGAWQGLNAPPVPLDRLAAYESRLWLLVVVLLVSLAIGLALVSWEPVGLLPWKLDALPIGLVLLVSLFGAYAISRWREIAQLRHLVHDLSHQPHSPTAGHVEKLFEIVERSQRGYRDLIDTFDDVLLSLSLKGEILATNRSFAALLGRSFSEIAGRQINEFLELADGAGLALVQRELPQLLERHQWSGVVRIRLKHETSARYFQCTTHALIREGILQGVCVLARDITIERENEARFKDLFETLQEGVYLADAEGKLEDINPAFVRMLGYENREALLGRPLSEFFLQPEEWETERRQLAQSDVLQGHEAVLRRRDGSPLSALHASALIRDTAGRVRRRQGTLVDISERHQIETRLQREQEFARRLVESFPDLVIALDREDHYTFVSPRSRELLGFSPEELIGTSFSEYVEPHSRREVQAFLAAIISGQCANGSTEFLFRRNDGEARLFRATASPLMDFSGRIAGVIAAARDITDSKRMEQQLIQNERLAAMGQMIAGVAHELNNPLTAVLGVTELLRDSTPDDSARRQLEIAHRQARRAAQIVQSLLTFSRPPQPRKICLNLSELIERSLQLHEHSLRSNRVTVDFSAPADLPLILGDTSQLTQVFLNLIANAEQAIREIRDHGTLRIRVTRATDRVIATFQDDGAGIPREILPKIFDPFFTTKRPGRGTGLGLSICLAILREHNGEIEAQPLPQGGSLFTIWLPIARGTALFLAEPKEATAASSSREIPKEAAAEYSVLVVDDEESIREMIREGLSARGFYVQTAAGVEEALSVMERRSFDAVLCDLNLRAGGGTEASGLGLYAAVRNAARPGEQKPVFLFMSGELAPSAVTQQLAEVGARTIQKPFRISELIAILTDQLGKSSSGAAQFSRAN
jgi:PAS domain S-box-containing protein